MRESRLSVNRSRVELFHFLFTCLMRNGPTHQGFSFLDVFKRLIFSMES